MSKPFHLVSSFVLQRMLCLILGFDYIRWMGIVNIWQGNVKIGKKNVNMHKPHIKIYATSPIFSFQRSTLPAAWLRVSSDILPSAQASSTARYCVS